MSKITYLGKMPDPFLRSDGTRVTPKEWSEYKKYLLNKIVDIEYGGMPPRPEIVEIEQLNDYRRGGAPMWFRIFAGTKEKQISFLLEMTVPDIKDLYPEGANPFAEGEKYPVLLTGDGCYTGMEGDTRKEILSRGYIAARFNRLEIANDVYASRSGGIHNVYPDMDYTDISAWAWGYSVCMDAFEKMPFVDETEVGITGHSRGGKTVMLAAATDERIKYVCINNSGCHGANSYRCVVTEQGPDNDKISERLSSMLKMFPTWMGKKLWDYENREQELPYDMHYFGAMIAPRFYLQNEGMQDYWINPIGAWQNFMAVKACYKYLGCENNAGAWFRNGSHRHDHPDFAVFLDFMDNARKGLPLQEHLKVNPYPDIEKNFDW